MFFSKCLAQERRRIRIELLKRIAILERKFTNDPSVLPDLLLANSHLTELDVFVLQGEVLRSKAAYRDEGERASKYFFRLETHRQRTKSIRSLVSSDGTVIDNGPGIRREIFSFYDQLYASRPPSQAQGQTFANLVKGRVPSTDRDFCDSPITWADILSSLGRMKKGKSPGTDGFTAELWVFLLPLIKEEFLRLLQVIGDSGRLPQSMTEGLIVLLPKAGNLSNLSNWRPITLLNADYKLLAKIFATRLSAILPSITSPTQTGAIKGRDVSRTSRFLTDITDLLHHRRESGILLQLDLQKAFDHVDWSFLFRVLESMGFGVFFRTWVQSLLVGSRACLKVNGYLTGFFRLGRSVRQGCPLSPLLYVLTTEPLCRALEINNSIPRVQLTDTTSSPLLFLHIDDNTVLTTSLAGVSAVVGVYTDYGLASGAKLNLEKCVGLWLGSCRSNDDLTVAGLNIKSAPLRVLGVYIGHDEQRVSALNWENRLCKFKGVLRVWKGRRLTLTGKVVVVNILASSTIWHVLGSTVLPSVWECQFRATVMDFLWGTGPHHTAYSTLCRPRQLGGFGLVDIATKERTFRLKEAFSLLDPATPDYIRTVSATALSLYGGRLNQGLQVLRLTIRPRLLYGMPSRYKSMLLAWASYVAAECLTFPPLLAIGHEPLFHNPRIPLDSFSLSDRRLFTGVGLTHLKDVLYEVIPGFLPLAAITEFFDGAERPFSWHRISRLYGNIRESLHPDWVASILHSGQISTPNNTDCLKAHFPVMDGKGVRADLNKRRKTLYRDLANYTYHMESSGELRWRQYFGGPLPRVNWKSFRSRLLPIALSDVSLKLIHQVFPVRHRLVHSAVVDTPHCPLCQTDIETVEHLFLNCSVSQPWWAFLLDQVLCLPSEIFGSNSQTRDLFLVFGHTGSIPTTSRVFWRVALSLAATTKLFIWNVRCQASFSGNCDPDRLSRKYKATMLLEMKTLQSQLVVDIPSHLSVYDLLSRCLTVPALAN